MKDSSLALIARGDDDLTRADIDSSPHAPIVTSDNVLTGDDCGWMEAVTSSHAPIVNMMTTFVAALMSEFTPS